MLKINEKKIPITIKEAKTFWQRLKGLMFEKKENFDYALIFYLPFEHKFSIHMFFVFFPITAVFLNSKKEVVDVKLLRPFWPHYSPKKPSKYLIEMPAKYSQKIKIGDKVEF